MLLAAAGELHNAQELHQLLAELQDMAGVELEQFLAEQLEDLELLQVLLARSILVAVEVLTLIRFLVLMAVQVLSLSVT